MKRITDLTRYTDLDITGHPDDITELVTAARDARVLVFSSAPRPANPGDPRVRVKIRLHLHHR
ncbi:hypothetical protein ACN27G_34865 [Plantactinospora sp. WMMB334]|uniref:hypothetical protein n=1 Tax=Plantactinospora sp. WMMB334 TaxID=3404119 RepID=UPI003B93AC37